MKLFLIGLLTSIACTIVERAHTHTISMFRIEEAPQPKLDLYLIISIQMYAILTNEHRDSIFR